MQAVHTAEVADLQEQLEASRKEAAEAKGERLTVMVTPRYAVK